MCIRDRFRDEPASLVEELFRPVAVHPGFELADMVGVLRVHQQRNLVGAEGALDL